MVIVKKARCQKALGYEINPILFRMYVLILYIYIYI